MSSYFRVCISCVFNLSRTFAVFLERMPLVSTYFTHFAYLRYGPYSSVYIFHQDTQCSGATQRVYLHLSTYLLIREYHRPKICFLTCKNVIFGMIKSHKLQSIFKNYNLDHSTEFTPECILF